MTLNQGHFANIEVAKMVRDIALVTTFNGIYQNMTRLLQYALTKSMSSGKKINVTFIF